MVCGPGYCLDGKQEGGRGKDAGSLRFPKTEGFPETEGYEAVLEDSAAGQIEAVRQKARM